MDYFRTVNVISQDKIEGKVEIKEENEILGLAAHPITGDIYYSNSCGNTVIKISSFDGTVSIVAGNGASGNSGDGGLAINAQMNCPCGLAFHPITCDLFITDSDNGLIRKVDESGIITSISVGTVTKPCAIDIDSTGIIYVVDADDCSIYKIENGTVNRQRDDEELINDPGDISIDSQNNIYFVNDCRVLKINHRSQLIIVAGSGKAGNFGDGGLATNATLNLPNALCVDKCDNIILSDYGNSKIRKIDCKSGIITTIAGYGPNLFSEGELAISSLFPNLSEIIIDSNNDIIIAEGCKLYKLKNLPKLEKHTRDHNNSTGITACTYVLKIYAPQFHNLVLNEAVIMTLDSNQKEIIQHMIDTMIYLPENYWYCRYDIIDVLYIVGMDNNFEIPLNRHLLIEKFMKSVNETTCAQVLSKLTTLKKQTLIENALLQKMFQYTIEKASQLMKDSSELITNPIIREHIIAIAENFPRVSKGYTPTIDFTCNTKHNVHPEAMSILFNQNETSDITIQIGSKTYYCHRSILASKITYFEALFNSGSSFQDLKDNVHVIETTEYEEVFEIILKFCYRIFDPVAVQPIIMPLFKCSSFYGVTLMADYCVSSICLTVENYFDIAQQLANHTNENLNLKLAQFGIQNIRALFSNKENLSRISEEVKDTIIHSLTSNYQINKGTD